ncbi:MAG: NAD(P)/FAD-dependent oxidoreductase [Patescibacteria group bacterium]|nr:NAD(P)/FAD-dependent oxidoreductase [Candidatus Omnitrophota bacterium]MBU1929758.1 NAD(P)/FAD-dependent oxidoreductase [Candidatus Omnitrophota bacterium]
MTKKYDYDVIIIGAGISGLVCGCYLAKAGLKTLIVEKNAKPGGYCTSFKQNGLLFDSCVYSLSNLSKGGRLRKILAEIGVLKNLDFIKFDKPDIVITKSRKIFLYNDVKRTISHLADNFPHEREGIKKLFSFITTTPVISLTKFRKLTFGQLLNSYFADRELKTILSIILLGYTGLPSSGISSVAACLLYKDFIFDGGYYVRGGMQKLSDVLTDKFKFFGGEIFYSHRATSIKIKDNIMEALEVNGKKLLFSKNIVAACDRYQILSELISDRKIVEEELTKMESADISLSGFLVYLGVDKKLDQFSELKSHVWIIDSNKDDMEIYKNLISGKYNYVGLSSSSIKNSTDNNSCGGDSLFLFSNSCFFDKEFWGDKNKERISDRLIELAKILIPDLDKHIKFKVIATPLSLYKWTQNHKGAAYGWADTVEQFASPNFSEQIKIKNIYFTGHWLNRSSGVAVVADSGCNTAKRIVRNINRGL